MGTLLVTNIYMQCTYHNNNLPWNNFVLKKWVSYYLFILNVCTKTLFRNKRIILDDIVQRNPSKFAKNLVKKTQIVFFSKPDTWVSCTCYITSLPSDKNHMERVQSMETFLYISTLEPVFTSHWKNFLYRTFDFRI